MRSLQSAFYNWPWPQLGMRPVVLRERAQVDRPITEVWALLSDIDLMALWNPKCIRCDAGGERARVGLRFKAVFRLSGPEREAECEVIHCRVPEILAIRYATDALRPGGYVDETFRLRSFDGGAKIIHEVDFTHSGLPCAIKALMKVLDLFGRKEGKSSLDGIRELADPSR